MCYIALVANLYRVLRKFYVLRLDRLVSIASCRLEMATQKETLPIYTQVVAYSTDRIMSCWPVAVCAPLRPREMIGA